VRPAEPRENGNKAVVERDRGGDPRRIQAPLDGTRVRIEKLDRASSAGREAVSSHRENVSAHGAVAAAHRRHIVSVRIGEDLAAPGEGPSASGESKPPRSTGAGDP